MDTPTTGTRSIVDVLKALKKKYIGGCSLDCNLFTEMVLDAFAGIVSGEGDPEKLFRMYSDEMMAEVLDEGDLALWKSKRAETGINAGDPPKQE